MRNIKIVYSYDGSKFNGFQRQPHLKTVQGSIERAIKKIFKEDINLISSGRTDLGVHADMQVSNFKIEKNIPIENIKYALNKALNGEIKIREISEVKDTFHSRYDVAKRWYRYRLATNENISVFENSYITEILYDIDIDKLNDIAKQFIGQYDFSSFMIKNVDVKNYTRTIYDIYFIKKDKIYEMYICGNAYLHSMIRIITATLLKVYYGDLDENYIQDKLNYPNVDIPKYLCSPNGLYLYKIEYKD